MRSIKFKDGEWLGYNGKELFRFGNDKEAAIDWRNGGIFEKKEPKNETLSFLVPDEPLVEKEYDSGSTAF